MSFSDWDIDASHWSDPFSLQPTEHCRQNHNSTYNPISTVNFYFNDSSMMASAKLSNSFYSHKPGKDCEDNAAPSDSDSDSFVSCVEELEDLTEGSPFEGFDVEGHGRTDSMGRQFKIHAEATANRNVVSEIASTQIKHQQKLAEASVGSAQAMALLAVRAKHYVTPESLHAWETASVTKQPASHPPSAAGRDFVLAGEFPNDPYYQKYGEPTSGDQAELDGNSQTEGNTYSEFVVTDVKGRGSQASYLQHTSDVAAGTKPHSQSWWVDEEQTSDSSPSVYSESIPEVYGQASYRQHEVRGDPCDVPLATQYAKASAADIDSTAICVLGWKEEAKVSAPADLANPSYEAAYEEPYQHEYQHEWKDEDSQGLPYQYNTAEASDDGCVCQHLMQMLQDWCNMTHGTGATDEEQIASVPDLLDFLKNSFSTSHASGSDGHHSIDPHTGQKQISPEDITVCPEDGFPDLSAQSQCNECWAQYSHINSILGREFEHTANPHISPLDKETRKAINKTNRTLAKLKWDVESALKAASEDDRHLDKTVTRMDAHKEQVERAMESHVRRLHEMVDICHKIAVGDFTKGHNQYRTQVEKEKKKVEKFSSHLFNLQTEIQDKFTEIKTHGLAATKTVQYTRSKYYALLARKPEIQTPVTPTYSFAVQRYTDKEIASMVGCIKITENVAATTPASQPPNSHSREPPRAQPTNPTANSRDNSRAPPATTTITPATHAVTGTINSTVGSMHKGVKKDSGLSTPAASMESLDSRCSEKNFATSSLGQKDKLSAFMTSVSSVASSASSATKKRKRKNKAEKQTECQDPYGYIRKEFNEKPSPKPQKITVKHNTSPNIVRLKGPEPNAIAPTNNGNVWMVYGNRGPQLQRMEADGNLRENIRVGGNAMAVVCLESELVLLASHSPRAHLKLIDKKRKQSDVHDLKVTPFSISVGKTGVVVAGRKALCWVSLSDWKTEWIVPEKDSPHKHVCSTAVTFLQGQEFICAADKSDNAVHFYLKNDATGFSTLRSYYGRSQSKGLADTLTEVNCAPEGAQFIPVSVSAHPAGFVAILDSAFNSVHVLNVEHSHQAVSVIPGSELYRSGIPSLIAFGYSDSSDAHLKLWTVGKIDGGECFVCHTPLKFQY